MRRLLLIAVFLAGCGSDEPTPSSSGDSALASLTVTVDDDGAQGPEEPRTLELECEAPSDSAACGAAAGISAADLRPVSGDTACTQIFGGPEEARIVGSIRGDDVDATFKRSDGCEIARWDKVKPLLDEVP
jgi:hypothetical protein